MTIHNKETRKCRIRASIENFSEVYRKRVESVWVPKYCWIRATSGESWNPCEYRKRSGPIRKNGWISVRTEKLFNPGDYRQKLESVRVPKNCPDQFEKMVEPMWVPKHCSIRATTGKSWNPCEYRKRSGPIRKNGWISGVGSLWYHL